MAVRSAILATVWLLVVNSRFKIAARLRLHCLRKNAPTVKRYTVHKLQIIRIDFDDNNDIWQKYSKYLVCMSQFSYRFACYYVIVSQNCIPKIMRACFLC